MALPQITRGVGFREDWLSATGAFTWTLDSGVSITSDGDLGTMLNMTSTNGATANTGLSGSTGGAGNITGLQVRAASVGGSTSSFDLKITYGDASTQTLT